MNLPEGYSHPARGKRTPGIMKTLIPTLCGIFLAASLATAQTVSETTTTTTTTAPALAPVMGTITTFDANGNQIVIAAPDAAPVTYGYTKTTTIVDEDGNPVAVDVVKTGAPVTVYYAPVGDRMVASKIIVRKTTTTTTAP